MRILLSKQDEIVMLEEALDRLDANEDCELFLGCSRRDGNESRRGILEKLNMSLAEYGSQDIHASSIPTILTKCRHNAYASRTVTESSRCQAATDPESEKLDKGHWLYRAAGVRISR